MNDDQYIKHLQFCCENHLYSFEYYYKRREEEKRVEKKTIEAFYKLNADDKCIILSECLKMLKN